LKDSETWSSGMTSPTSGEFRHSALRHKGGLKHSLATHFKGQARTRGHRFLFSLYKQSLHRNFYSESRQTLRGTTFVIVANRAQDTMFDSEDWPFDLGASDKVSDLNFSPASFFHDQHGNGLSPGNISQLSSPEVRVSNNMLSTCSPIDLDPQFSCD